MTKSREKKSLVGWTDRDYYFDWKFPETWVCLNQKKNKFLPMMKEWRELWVYPIKNIKTNRSDIKVRIIIQEL